MKLYNNKSNQMAKKPKYLTEELIECLGKLKVPTQSDQKKLKQYLQGFQSPDIVLENSSNGKGIAYYVIFLLSAKFPQIMTQSVCRENKKILLEFSHRVEMTQNLENNTKPTNIRGRGLK